MLWEWGFEQIIICMELIKNRNDLLRNSNHSLKDLPNNFCCMISNYDRELVLSYLKILIKITKGR